MAADRVEEHVERVAVEDVFRRMDLEAEVDPVLVVHVEDRPPPAALLGETLLDQPRRPLGIGVEIGPGEGAGEADVLGQAEAAGDTRGLAHLIGGPLAALLRIAAHRGRALPVEQRVIGRMDRHHLALEMRRELADGDPDVGESPLDLIAIGLALVSLVEIEKAVVPGGNLDRLVAEVLGPTSDAGERIVRRRIARELSKKEARALDGPHCVPSQPVWLMRRGSADQRRRHRDTGETRPVVNALAEGPSASV